MLCRPQLDTLISDIFAFLVDLRAVACVKRGLVTQKHWRYAAELLWPGAMKVLFGTPAFQVRTLLASASVVESPLRWIDPEGLATCDAPNSVLLEIRYNGLLILRGMSSIIISQKHHYLEEIVSFSLSLEVAEVLEWIGLSLYQRVGGTSPRYRYGSRFGMTLNEGMDIFKELTVWLQVWYSSPDKPIVLQPTFNLQEVLWQDNDIDDDSRCMQLFYFYSTF